ncbi:MAG: polysaccharide export protein [Candidatus Eisenbacteria bacterium]|nr:polysaccharide export protein [Candidatus Eisenbacteria bacterium]
MFLAIVALAAGGCAATQKQTPPTDVETGTVRLERIERPEQAGQWTSGEDRIGWEAEAYRLQPGDEVEIRVLYNADLSTTTKILPDGTISVPIQGQTQAAGKTLVELEQEIARGMSDYLVDPKVTVIAKRLAGNYVFVLGEVRNPGAYEITGTMTVVQAVARAGGSMETAKLNSVLLVRRTAPDAVTGIRVNVSTLLGNQAGAKDRVIRAYDIVYVPKTLIGRIDTFLEQFFTRTAAPWVWYVWLRTAVDWDEEDVTALPVPE